jgi:DNA-binding NtrC family response regulator
MSLTNLPAGLKGPESSRPTVLFVDDEPHVLAGLRDALRKKPYKILTATSGEQALSLLAERRVDVVVSDEQMPNMTGSRLLSIVRQKYPHTVRIVLTGQASIEGAIRAINEGEIFRFLTKPCHPTDLAFTIQHGLHLRDLARESSRLLLKVRRQRLVLREIEQRYPGISELKVDNQGAILLEEDAQDVEDLIREIEQEEE